VPEVSSLVEPACDDSNCDKSQESNADASDACVVDTSSPNIHTKDDDACADARSPGSWSVSFEQFIASILTESEVVEHLSQPLDIKVRPLRPFITTVTCVHFTVPVFRSRILIRRICLFFGPMIRVGQFFLYEF
jgi:hypothetical protein